MRLHLRLAAPRHVRSIRTHCCRFANRSERLTAARASASSSRAPARSVTNCHHSHARARFVPPRELDTRWQYTRVTRVRAALAFFFFYAHFCSDTRWQYTRVTRVRAALA